jgi:glycosyltransferase involved in cell wall biosynthesis
MIRETTAVAEPLDITVVIPTKNRLGALKQCLTALDRQTLPRQRWEVLVVDDGSTDDTAAFLSAQADAGVLRTLSLTSGGPARARNAAIRDARGELLVFIGDDTYPAPAFLEQHLAAGGAPASDTVAVVGLTEWASTAHVTPLMRYSGLGQFDYHLVDQGRVDAEDLPFWFFYTSNVSICRSFLLRHNLLFDEDFRHAMGEDGELAYRAVRYGLRLRYAPAAVAFHDHPTTFSATRARFRLKGEVTILQARKHHEWADLGFLTLSWRGRLRHALRRAVAGTLAPGLAWLDRREIDFSAWHLGWAFDFVFEVAEFDGMLAAFGRGRPIPEELKG